MGRVTDGRGAANPKRVWEVKTRHDWITAAGEGASALFSPYIGERAWKLGEQRALCPGVARRCGFEYVFAFDDETIARFMQRHWGKDPPVFYRPG